MSPALMTTGWTLDTAAPATDGSAKGPAGSEVAATFAATWRAALGEPDLREADSDAAAAAPSAAVSSESTPASGPLDKAPRSSRERREPARDSASDDVPVATPVSVPLAYLTAPVYPRAPARTDTAGSRAPVTPVVTAAWAASSGTDKPAQPVTTTATLPSAPIPFILPGTAGAPDSRSTADVVSTRDVPPSVPPAVRALAVARTVVAPAPEASVAPLASIATPPVRTPPLATRSSGISTPESTGIGEFSMKPAVSSPPGNPGAAAAAPQDAAPNAGPVARDPARGTIAPETAATVTIAAEAPATGAIKPDTSHDGGLAFAVRLSGDSQPSARSAELSTPATETVHPAVAPVAASRSDARRADTSANNGQAAADTTGSGPLPNAAGRVPDAVRPAAETAAVATPAETSPPETARQISVRIPGTGDQSAFVRLSQRGSDVVISVHGSDANLVDSLRSGLPGLSSRLESHDVRAEVWQPGGGNGSPAGEDRRGNSSHRDQTGDTSGQSQQQQQQQDRRGRDGRPDWLDAMEGLVTQVPGRKL